MRPIFAKILELFTGGFSYTATARGAWSDGATLTKGTLLQVNELNRTCIPIKRGRAAVNIASGEGTAVLEENHHFLAGDHIYVEGATGSKTITSVVGNTINVNSDFGRNAATGAFIVHVATSAATAGNYIDEAVGNANSIARYPSTVEAGASVTALRRGTVFSRRVAPVIAAIDNMPGTIQFSNTR